MMLITLTSFVSFALAQEATSSTTDGTAGSLLDIDAPVLESPGYTELEAKGKCFNDAALSEQGEWIWTDQTGCQEACSESPQCKGYAISNFDACTLCEGDDMYRSDEEVWTAYQKEATGAVMPETGAVMPECVAVLGDGTPKNVEFVYTLNSCSEHQAVDFVLTQDLSGSYGDDLPNIRALWSNIMTDMATNYDAEFGVTSYSDLPWAPVGAEGDYPFKINHPLSSDQALMQLIVDGLVIKNGNDVPESQLWALYETAVNDELDWRDGSMKLVLLTTDAQPHMQGDAASLSAQITAAGFDSDLMDYPSIDMLRTVLSNRNVMPIFAVTANVKHHYQSIVSELGFGYAITLAHDSSNLMDVVREAMTGACSTVYLNPMMDPENRVTVSPGSFVGEQGKSYDFTVTVDTSGLTSPYTATLAAVDGSILEIQVLPSGAFAVDEHGVGICVPPTSAPTNLPTPTPSTAMPTVYPTTSEPTSTPTMQPTFVPTATPTMQPTTSVPTATPTMQPTTFVPTATPTMQPTTYGPTATPTPAHTTGEDGTGLPDCVALVADGTPQSVEFTYTLNGCSEHQSVDFVLNQDLSGSYGDDIPNIRTLWPNIMADLSSNYDAMFGITSYSDLPFAPFGQDGLDFPYRMDDQLTNSAADSQAVIDALTIASGGDYPESQLWALYEVANDESLGWREDSMKIVLITTDAPPHMEGDAIGMSAEIEDWKSTSGYDSDLSDYPSVDMLRMVLSNRNILPIFAVTSRVVETYADIVNELGFGYAIELASDSSNLMDVVQEAMTGACSTVSLQTIVDPEARVTVSPGSFMGELGESYEFTVVVDTADLDAEYHAVLAAMDGSTVDIRVKPSGSVYVNEDGFGICEEPTKQPTAPTDVCWGKPSKPSKACGETCCKKRPECSWDGEGEMCYSDDTPCDDEEPATASPCGGECGCNGCAGLADVAGKLVDALVYKDEHILKSFEATTAQFEKALMEVTDITERLIETNTETTNKLIDALMVMNREDHDARRLELKADADNSLTSRTLASRLMLSESSE